MKNRLQKIKSKAKKATDGFQKKQLYSALLCIYKFYQLEDLQFLKSERFLKLCSINYIHWKFNKDWLKKDFLNSEIKQSWPFQISCPLDCKTNNYGELIFFSFQKFSQSKKSFLKKIAFFTASSLYYIENKQKMENIKQQWGGTFDSFSQAFCITDKNFKIIRANQSFQKISDKTKSDLFAKSLFEILPVPVQMPKQEEQEGSWLAKGEREGKKFCWEISFKPLFLKKENIQALLFLIKDVTEEMEIEERLSAQAKERELGLIKGSIAHELNNPIAGMKALLDIVEKRLPPDKSLEKNYLKEMQKAVNRCQEIISHLLSVSHSTERPNQPFVKL